MEPSEVTSVRDPLLAYEPRVASMATQGPYGKPCVASTPPRSLGKNNSGHIMNSDSRNMIVHCYTYWRNREPEHSVEDTSKFVADVLGVSVKTVFRIGFKHEKRTRNSLVIDRDDIADWRNGCLHDVFFLEDTLVTAGHTRSIVWIDTVVQKRGRLFSRGNSLTTGLKPSSGVCQRLIVMHIGSEDGFVDDCLDIFGGQNTGHYHEEMNDNRFQGSLNDVLQDFSAGSVIVLDNALTIAGEKRLSTTAWKKEKIQE
ncbi:hypothetical protein HPB50_008183 [Hyalomma asiaticum]|uniref:Uncharacterized protein n=1 Tax=Hyalomma asiaticum TaxID=266040 RepID=A0ACB7SM42_HYAAI|nr:hypothetical protein HPB50_008183 [Hyalomma asiaticum]